MNMSEQREELLSAVSKHTDEYLSALSARVFYIQRLKIIESCLPDSNILNMFKNDFKSFIKRIRKNDNTQARWNARKEKRLINNLISSSPSPAQAPRRKRM